MDLDKELASALERREPPPGFTERVLARIAAEGKPKSTWRPVWLARPPVLRWALASGLAGLLVFTGISEYRRHQGEIAAARMVLALHIAGAKLNYAQRKVQQVTLPPAAAMIEETEEKQ
jgi:hypothetical protein